MAQIHSPHKIPVSIPQSDWNFGIKDELPKQYYPDWLPSIKFAQQPQSKFTDVNRILAEEKERVAERLKKRVTSEKYTTTESQTGSYVKTQQLLRSIRLLELRRMKSKREENLKQWSKRRLVELKV